MKRAPIFRVMILALAISIPLLFGQAGCGRDEETIIYVEEKDRDPCEGPVPCLRENFGATVYEFEDQYGDPVNVLANGGRVWIEGVIYDESGSGYPFELYGMIIDCYGAELGYGWIDWDGDGESDTGDFVSDVEGELEICNKTLRVYDITIEGIPYQDIEATYTGPWVGEPSE